MDKKKHFSSCSLTVCIGLVLFLISLQLNRRAVDVWRDETITSRPLDQGPTLKMCDKVKLWFLLIALFKIPSATTSQAKPQRELALFRRKTHFESSFIKNIECFDCVFQCALPLSQAYFRRAICFFFLFVFFAKPLTLRCWCFTFPLSREVHFLVC